MTAGAGILHIETPPEHLVMSGGLFHGFQLWVNLPAAKKWSPPAYQDVRANDVALLTSADGGSLLRVIAGEVAGNFGPGSTQTPITLLHASIAPGAELRLPWRKDYNALVYTMSGFGFVGDELRPVQAGQLAVFGDGDSIVIRAANQQEARSPELELFILGGAPIKEPVAWMGPFVMNTKKEVLQAFEDFQKGLLGSIPAIYKEDAKPKAPLNRTGEGSKLGGDTKGADVLDVHGAPTDMQEG
jgi:redox-sensitive bicupin YhaK (pirin superfamily)